MSPSPVALELSDEAIRNFADESVAPWPPCWPCRGEGGGATVVEGRSCPACVGLGLALPDDWLASSWSIMFVLPVENLDGRTPEAFLELLLRGSYPQGSGFRIVPTAHPKFADAVRFMVASLMTDGIKHQIVDESSAIFKIEKANGAPPMLHAMRVVLLEDEPTKRA